MDEQIHAREGVGRRENLLRGDAQREALPTMPMASQKLRLDQEPGRAGCRIMRRLTRLRIYELGDKPPDFLRCEELACTLPLPLGELAEEVLVCPAEDI